jgi:acyl carrier protein
VPRILAPRSARPTTACSARRRALRWPENGPVDVSFKRVGALCDIAGSPRMNPRGTASVPCLEHPPSATPERRMSTDGIQTREKVRGYILENLMFSSNDGDLADGASLLDRGIIDSTGVLEIVLYLEEEFQVKVKDSDMLPANFDSVDNIVGFVSRLQSN